MKIIFLIMAAFTMTACGSGFSPSDGASQAPPKEEGATAPLIAPPTVSCGGADCFTGVSSLALKNDVGAMSSNAGYYASFLSDYYDSLKTPLATLRVDFDILNTLLKDEGYSSCSAIPTSGTLQHPTIADFSIDFKTPTVGFDMGTGNGLVYTEKRIVVLKNGTPEAEIEVHCGGSSPTQTVQIVWLDNGGLERYNFNYEYNTATKRINLSGASIWDMAGGDEWKKIFGFKNQADGGFGFFYYDSYQGTRNFLITQTALGASQNIEYAVAVDSSPANTTWTPDSIAYGSDFADDFERVCALGFKGSSPTYSVDPADCGTSGTIAVANSWLPVAGISNGSGGWTSDYLDGLFLLDIQN